MIKKQSESLVLCDDDALDAASGGAPAFGPPTVVVGPGTGGKDQSRLPKRGSGETTLRKNVFKSAPLGKKGDRLDAPKKSGWFSW